MAAKVFGIGFHKTGTSSLAQALQILGYDVIGLTGGHDPDLARNALPMALALVPKHDAFVDNPWPVLFRELDDAFPGSRFILTERAPEDWIRSVVNHFGTHQTPMRKWIYGAGSPVGNEALYLQRYVAHNEAVKAHFAGRNRDFLHFPVPSGAGWSELCRFLGHDVPRLSFPHANARLKMPERAGLTRRLLRRVGLA